MSHAPFTEQNPCGLQGIDFVEFASADPEHLDALWLAFGFSRAAQHPDGQVDLYTQGDIRLLVNRRASGFAAQFARSHGPCASAMGWRFADAQRAFAEAVRRGGRPFEGQKTIDAPAIYGIGESLIYFLGPDQSRGGLFRSTFVPHPAMRLQSSRGFTTIDHLTNNVHKGTMQRWASFYRDVFGFTEVRYFDIRGVKTGLTSYALRSPDGSFCIPINEGDESKSQIEEYLREYQGPGIQHIAFLTDDLLHSLDLMDGGPIETLDIDDEYYAEVFDRVPGVTEDHDRIKRHQVLVDGDEEGYLLQIFTKNLIGPIFIELIQRKNHLSFGEGNFGALFRSIERDPERRGVL
jgi:4-hydroxyphenylpyruvate dioxygenase